MRQNKKDIALEIFRFLLVGGFATICDYVVFYLFNIVFLKNINQFANIFISESFGFLTGLFVNWFLQKFVFKYITKEQTKDAKVFTKFFILSLLGFSISQLGMFLCGKYLVGKLIINFIIEFDFWKLFMKCLMTGIVLIINYIGRKLFVFKEIKKEDLN